MIVVTIVYLVNQYPAVTHTFIKREILALERLGLRVARVAMRSGRALVDPGDLAEKARTSYLLDRPMGLAKSLLWTMATRPLAFAAAVGAVIGMMWPSDRSPPVHLFYLIEACRLAQMARQIGAEHIHAHFGTNSAEVAMLASIICNVPFSFTVHGYDEYDKPEFLALSTKIGAAHFVACVSWYGRSQLLRWCDRADRDKIKLVRCGLERGFADQASDAPNLAQRFVCVGRFCREKAQDILIHAIAALAAKGQPCELVLVGDGETRCELEALIAELGLSASVRLTGWLASAQVREEILGARALVVPSFAENLPVVIMEAMALRRPVVATYIAGIPELVVPGETGWLAPASSVEALAGALAACLEAPEARLRDMGALACSRVLEWHDVDREAGKLAAHFALRAQAVAACADAIISKKG